MSAVIPNPLTPYLIWIKLAIAAAIIGGLMWAGWIANGWRHDSNELAGVRKEFDTYRVTVETERAEQAARDEQFASDISDLRESYAVLRRRPPTKLTQEKTDANGCPDARLSDGFWVRYNEAATNP